MLFIHVMINGEKRWSMDTLMKGKLNFKFPSSTLEEHEFFVVKTVWNKLNLTVCYFNDSLKKILENVVAHFLKFILSHTLSSIAILPDHN